MTNPTLDISIVVPLYNEHENVVPIFEAITNALAGSKYTYEIIYVNDGSNDNSEELLDELFAKHKTVTVVNLHRNKGKAPGLEIAFSIARGKFAGNIDCDLQYDPKDILTLVAELEKGKDVANGKRMSRSDNRDVIFTSKLFNIVMRAITGLPFDDYFSGLKMYRRSVIRYLSLFGDLYRFAPVYAHRQGFKVVEIPIPHYGRERGKSKYSFFGRLQLAMGDILTSLFTMVFNEDRVYRMGLAANLLLSLGALLALINLLTYRYEWQPGSFFGRTSVFVFFIAAQLLIFKMISRNFFSRHEDQQEKRRRNIKNILRHGENASIYF